MIFVKLFKGNGSKTNIKSKKKGKCITPFPHKSENTKSETKKSDSEKTPGNRLITKNLLKNISEQKSL